jgi:mannose-6-phosphate isomerase-like protein (cupin superfamily)
MDSNQLEQRIVRFGDLKPCKTAFIDAHTPGSDQKENFTIIGGGVSESPDQFVHIRETPGFNIGAAGQPPKCKNSLHSHRTAEVFFVQSGRWRFFWGLHGTDGEVVLQEGDIFDIPTGVFRGFENIGTDYGMIMAILGGDDAGGGVIWAPHVLDAAHDHGLILAETGRLYDTAKGEQLPDGVQPMPRLTDAELEAFPEAKAADVVPTFVKRYWDMKALSTDRPVSVIGPGKDAMICDRTGFEVSFMQAGSDAAYTMEQDEVLMVHRGYWRLSCEGNDVTLAPGDVCSVPPRLTRSLAPCRSGDAALFRVKKTDDAPGKTRV